MFKAPGLCFIDSLSQIKDFPTLIDHISQSLLPGGLMELMEFDFRVYDASCKPFFLPNGVMEPPWFPRWMSFCNMAVRQRGGTPDAANMLYSWTLRHPAFEDVVYDEYFVPTAPFMSSEEPNYHSMRSISEILREDILVCNQGYLDLTAHSPFAFCPGLSSVWSATFIGERASGIFR
jgi:hypothetical protein